MKEFPRGSVCILIPPAYPEFVGLECTIVEGLSLNKTRFRDGKVVDVESYVVTVQGKGDELFHAIHSHLKLKKFPGELESWCNEKVKGLLNSKPEGLVDEEILEEEAV